MPKILDILLKIYLWNINFLLNAFWHTDLYQAKFAQFSSSKWRSFHIKYICITSSSYFSIHMQGIEYADSFNTNPNKWLLTNFDCSTLWVRDRIRLTSALVVDPLYLKHGYSDAAIDYRHWGVPLSRRLVFNEMKYF